VTTTSLRAGGAIALVIATSGCLGRDRPIADLPPPPADASTTSPDASAEDGSTPFADAGAIDSGPPDGGPVTVVTDEARAGCDVACTFTHTCVLRTPAGECITDCLSRLSERSAACLSAYEAAGRCGDGMLCVQLRSGICDAQLSRIPDAC
jgi:hypothetical protein